jgi:two-component system sensor histidine kinase PhoQ
MNKIPPFFMPLFSGWQKNSLKLRLVLSALLMIFILLPIIGFVLSSAFEKQLKSAVNNELSAYSYSILAVAEVEDEKLFMPEVLLENQFNVIDSGLYAQINRMGDSGQPLWISPSLLTQTLTSSLPRPTVGTSLFSEVSLANNHHFLYSFSVNFKENNQEFPVTLHIIKDKKSFISGLNNFQQQLWRWLGLVILLFVFVQLIWLLWTLKPLSRLSQELMSVEQGKKNTIEQNYPYELQQVTSQLNTLLQTEQNQRKRYRNALSDLAHSLKNPLAIIQSQNELSVASTEQLALINHMIEHQLKRAQSAGNSAWHLGIEIKPVVDKLIATLAKIYQTKHITFGQNIEAGLIFKGDEADLMEILGNLLDNATKAAKTQVFIDVHVHHEKIVIQVSDDGQGIEPTMRDSILQRGLRADTYQKGHGIGLAIVRDLVESYQGTLTISLCDKLKGALFIIRF